MGKDDCHDCTSLKKDRRKDLVFKFNAQELVNALGAPNLDECRVLHLTGSQLDGCPITGEDVVRYVPLDPRQSDPAAIEEAPKVVPQLSNHPNPFSPRTRISFTLPEAGQARLAVYDVAGREVTVLVDEHRGVGTWSTDWDGTDRHGAPVAGGMYFYRLTVTPAGGHGSTIVQQRKMLLGR